LARRKLYLPVLIAAAVAVACAVALSAVSEKAEATFPGKNGRIVYASYDRPFPKGDSEIYTINPDGSGKTQLTNNDRDDIDPAYSPDGKKIVYAGEVGPKGNYELYTIGARGGGKSRVTNSDTYPQKLSWGSRP
jgi:Tol biopolymer transport system component